MMHFHIQKQYLLLLHVLPALLCSLHVLSLPQKKIHTRHGRCTIDIRPNLAPEEFLKHYYLQKPVIIPIRTTSTQTKSVWSIERLVKMYGKVTVKVGSSSTLTKNRGTGTNNETLSKFIQKLHAANTANRKTVVNVHEETFAFERNPHLFQAAPELVASAHAIPEIHSYLDLLNRTDTTLSDWYFSLGNQFSGVHSHHHTDGWSFLFQGSKRWWFWPPWQALPAFTHVARFPIKQWYDYIYPQFTRQERPAECLAIRGDFVYVPEGWWHSTMTTSLLSLGVASQVIHPITAQQQQWSLAVDSYWQLKQEQQQQLLPTPRSRSSKKGLDKELTRLKRMLDRFEKIQKEYPNNAEAWLFGGTVMGEISHHYNRRKSETNSVRRSSSGSSGSSGDMRAKVWARIDKELTMKKKAVELNPRNCVTLHNYGIILAKARQVDTSIEVLNKAIDLKCGHFLPRILKSLQSIQKVNEQQLLKQKQKLKNREKNKKDL